jgi:hypothetical protein
LMKIHKYQRLADNQFHNTPEEIRNVRRSFVWDILGVHEVKGGWRKKGAKNQGNQLYLLKSIHTNLQNCNNCRMYFLGTLLLKNKYHRPIFVVWEEEGWHSDPQSGTSSRQGPQDIDQL